MRIVVKAGQMVSRSSQTAGFTIALFLESILFVPRNVASRRGFAEIVRQMFYCGVKALGVTMVVALFMGMILSLQSGLVMREYGQAERVGLLVAQTTCRGMGPIITAIIVTAMVGSTIAAEIGTMKVSEEIEALEVMSISPTRFLVTPRVVALVLMTFVLTVFVDFVAILGGGLVASARLGVSLDVYLDQAQGTLAGRDLFGMLPKDVYAGLIQAIVFGALIAAVACAQGLRAQGGALGVGKAVRRTVVSSIMLILVFGYLMTAFFYT